MLYTDRHPRQAVLGALRFLHSRRAFWVCTLDAAGSVGGDRGHCGLFLPPLMYLTHCIPRNFSASKSASLSALYTPAINNTPRAIFSTSISASKSAWLSVAHPHQCLDSNVKATPWEHWRKVDTRKYEFYQGKRRGDFTGEME